MAETTGIITIAGLTNLEREALSTFAVLALHEKEVLETFAGWSELQYETQGVFAGWADLDTPADVKITIAAISTLEAPTDAVRTFAAWTDLDTPAQVLITFAVNSTLDAPDYAQSTFATFADLVYYESDASLIVDKIDLRSEGPQNPVLRLKQTLVLPTGDTTISVRLNINCLIKQITLKSPDLGTETVKLQLLDELGAELYESSSIAESTTVPLFSSEPNLPLAGNSTTLSLIVTAAQGSAKTFVVLIYGV